MQSYRRMAARKIVSLKLVQILSAADSNGGVIFRFLDYKAVTLGESSSEQEVERAAEAAGDQIHQF